MKSQLTAFSEFPCPWTCCFSLAALHTVFKFWQFLTPRLGMVLFGLILFGTLCFLDLDACFLSRLGKFSDIMSSNIFSVSLFFPSKPLHRRCWYAWYCPEGLLSGPHFFLFFLFCSASVISISLSSSSLIHSSVLCNLLWIPSRVFLTSVIIHFCLALLYIF